MPNDTRTPRHAPRDALTLRRVLETPVARDPAQEIVYRDLRRHTYADLEARVHRLAGALAALGVRPGDTVAVMDHDSHRYLEAFFAVPMMGAVLHTINVRLSPEQILYTIDLEVKAVEGIDRTSVGKVNKRALREKHL